jgi:hypothetical protein
VQTSQELNGSLAQSVERQPEELRVGSSILSGATISRGRSKMAMHLLCKQAIGGSSPFVSTISQ